MGAHAYLDAAQVPKLRQRRQRAVLADDPQLCARRAQVATHAARAAAQHAAHAVARHREGVGRYMLMRPDDHSAVQSPHGLGIEAFVGSTRSARWQGVRLRLCLPTSGACACAAHGANVTRCDAPMSRAATPVLASVPCLLQRRKPPASPVSPGPAHSSKSQAGLSLKT